MNYTEDHDILRKASRQEVDLDALHAWFASQGAKRSDDLNQYVGVMLAGCLRLGIDPWVVYGQFSLETENGTSYWWENNLNPAGIGVVGVAGQPGDGTNSQKWLTGSDAAFGHLAHLVAYLWPMDWTESGWPDAWPDPWVADKRFMAPINRGYFATDLASLGQQRFEDGMWRGWSDNDPNYGAKVAARANQLYAAAGKDATKPVALSIRQSFIPAGRKNRPGIKLNSGPLWITVHDTGNTNAGADAEMHREFTHNPNTGVSFTFTVDDAEAIQLLPCDEIGYHAADGCNNRATDVGCFQSVAIELCINRDGDWWQAYANLKDLCAAIITGDSRIAFAGRSGDFSETRITTHQKVSDTGKWCPATILNQGLFADLQAGIVNRVKLIRDGATPAPSPVYAKPYPVTKGTQLINDHLFLAPGGKTVQREQAPMQYADAGAVPTGPPFPKGHKFAQEDFTHYVQGTDGNLWVVLTDGSRFPALAFVAE